MTNEEEREVREYLFGWSAQDWEGVDDLCNGGMSLSEAVVAVHRVRSGVCLSENGDLIPIESEQFKQAGFEFS